MKRRDIEHKVEYVQEREIPSRFLGREFRFKIAIDGLLGGRILENQQVWYFFLNVSGHTYRLSVNGSFEADYFQIESNPLFKAKPYVAGDLGLSLLVMKTRLHAFLKEADYTNGQFTSEIALESDELDAAYLESVHHELVFKRREQIALFEYYEEKCLHMTLTDSVYRVNVEIPEMFDGDLANKEQAWDAFVRVRTGENKGVEWQIFCNSTPMFNYETVASNSGLKVKPYVTGKKTLSVLIRRKVFHGQATDLLLKSDTLRIEGEISSDEYDVHSIQDGAFSLILKKRFKVGNEFTYFDGVHGELDMLSGKFTGQFALSTLLQNKLQTNEENWDIFIEIQTGANKHIDVPIVCDSSLDLAFNEKVSRGDQRLLIAPAVNKVKQVSLAVKKDHSTFSSDVIRLAVLGSCFSRNAFESKSYFNPEYKQFYQCAFTHIQSSIISLMSDEASLDHESISNLKIKEQVFIERDFKKTFMTELSALRPEYLIIDFLADAARDVFQMSENSYVSSSLLLKETDLFTELYQKNNLVKHTDNEYYFKLWKIAIDKFIDQVLDILPEENIILSVGQLTDKYYDSNGVVKSYSDSRKKLLRRNNYLWDKLNNYFIHRLPNSKVIDLTEDGYIGHYDHPYGNSPSHYESDYYKEYLRKLNDLVRLDLQAKRSVDRN